MSNLKTPTELDFSGNIAENWKLFKQRFNLYLVASGMETKPERVKSNLLLHLVGQQALVIYNTFSFPNAEDREKPSPIIERFDNYFNPKKNVAYERHKFNTFSRTTESFDEYVTELKIRAQNCDFGDMIDDLIRDRIVCGIADSQIQERLLQHGTDLTLDKAIDVCRAAEATSNQLKGLQEEKAIQSVKKKTTPFHSKHFKHEERNVYGNKAAHSYTRNCFKDYRNDFDCQKCGKRHPPRKCPAYGKQCFKCSRMNHFSKNCFSSKERFQGNSTRTNRRVHVLQDEGNEEEEFFIGAIENISERKVDKWRTTMTINGQRICFKIDSGAQVNTIPLHIFNQIRGESTLNTTGTKLVAYGGTKIEVAGKCELYCTHKINTELLNFIVVKNNVEPILGASDSEKLKLISRLYKIGQEHKQTSLEKLLKDYEDVFEGTGCLDLEYKIEINSEVQPVVNPARKVPFKLRDVLECELDRMEAEGIITKQEDPTDWVHNLVIIEKPNGKLRLCLDPRDLNKAIRREHYHLPTLEEIAGKLAKAKVFSVLDASNGFWQIPLSKESTDLCTFNTPFGRYKFTRMPFGISSAPEVYQRTMDDSFHELESTTPYIDDILVWGENDGDHEGNLKDTLDVCRKRNIKLNKRKCTFGVNQVEYLGHLFTSEGLQIDPRKVQAITEMPSPKNIQELQRFLGILTYVAKFIPGFSDETLILRELQKQGVEFCWLDQHEKAFKKLKAMLASPPVLQYFDVDKEIVLSVDASMTGLGAVLLQDGKPIAYASRTLTQPEKNYAQIEKEMLAITFGAERFHQYIYGQQILVETDHKPLEIICKKPLNCTPPRLQRFRLRLQKYQLNVQYKPGKELIIADALSRASIPGFETDNQDTDFLREAEHQVHLLLKSLPVSESKLQVMKDETNKDAELALLKSVIKRGWPNVVKELQEELRKYWTYRDELHVVDSLVLKGHQILVPATLRSAMLKLIHESHQGVEKCKSRAKDCLFWPNMTKDIESLVLACETCITFRKINQREPLMPHEVPTRPWEKLGADFLEFKGKQYLLVVDYYSKYPELMHLTTTNADSVIMAMKSIFARHGIPHVLFSDNGPPFNSLKINEFAKEWGFKHQTSSPYFPQSNGMIERTIQTVKQMLKKAKDPYVGLLNLRNTSAVGMTISPAEMLMGRKLQTKLPTISKQLMPKVLNHTFIKQQLEMNQNKQRHYFDRQTKELGKLKPHQKVYLREGGQWKPARVARELSPRSYEVEMNNSTYRRNRRHIMNIPSSHSETIELHRENGNQVQISNEDTRSENENQVQISNEDTRSENPIIQAEANESRNAPQSQIKTRSGRVIRKPERLKDFIT